MAVFSTPLLVILLAANAPSASDVSSDNKCWDAARGQLGMNECAEAERKAADAEMNIVYRQLMAGPDEVFAARLRAAQRAWLAFRDTHVASLYGVTKDSHGSSQPMCEALALRDLTRERTQQLRAMLDPEEGDICGARPAR